MGKGHRTEVFTDRDRLSGGPSTGPPPHNSARLKIGYLVTHYPALSQTFVLNEILGLEERGIDMTIFSLGPPNDPKFNYELSLVKAPVHYLPWNNPPELVNAFRFLRKLDLSEEAAECVFDFVEGLPEDRMGKVLVQAVHLAHLASGLGIQHVHAHFMHNTASCAYLLKCMTGIPFSVTAHAFDIYQEPVDPVWFRQIYSAAGVMVTVCENNRRYLLERFLGGDGSRVVRIYNGLPLKEIRVAPSSPRSRLILGVGRLVEKKGWPVLLEACSLLKKDGIEFECVLAGKGAEMERLLALRSRLGLEEAVWMPGGLKRDEVLTLMSSARVLAAPCITTAGGDRDALPTVILEALALGLPVVSTRVNGIPEIIDEGREGLLVDEGDAQALAAALEEILTDDGLRTSMSQAGPVKVAERFDREKTLPQLEEVFQRTLHAHAAGPASSGKASG